MISSLRAFLLAVDEAELASRARLRPAATSLLDAFSSLVAATRGRAAALSGERSGILDCVAWLRVVRLPPKVPRVLMAANQMRGV